MSVSHTQSETILFDPERIKALRDTLLLDTKAEAAFDRLTNMAARILGAPISLISLIDVDRQFVKSSEGTTVEEVPLSHSLCKHVVMTGEPLVIEDARTHHIVQDNPGVDAYDVVGYLGLPINTADGHNIGSLCVIDHKPRAWSEEEIGIIRDLANSVMMEIELRVQIRAEKQKYETQVLQAVQNMTSHSDTNHFGIYEIVQKIGTGGMSDVYVCKHGRMNSLVAVKQLRDTGMHRKDYLQRFQQEAKIVSQLKHENIIRVFDFGVRDQLPYMVMEYINGDDLDDFLKRNGKLDFFQDGAILLDIAQALDYAHAQGVIHRDIKPSNVMLRRRFRDSKPLDQFHATLMDFGIAKLTDQQQNHNMTADNLVGTINYISPEQIQSSDTLDYRADIYSLGVLSYKFLTGHLPFESASFGQMIQMHLTAPVPDPRQYVPELTDQQVKALQMALAKDPQDRPSSALAFVQMLAR